MVNLCFKFADAVGIPSDLILAGLNAIVNRGFNLASCQFLGFSKWAKHLTSLIKFLPDFVQALLGLLRIVANIQIKEG